MEEKEENKWNDECIGNNSNIKERRAIMVSLTTRHSIRIWIWRKYNVICAKMFGHYARDCCFNQKSDGSDKEEAQFTHAFKSDF